MLRLVALSCLVLSVLAVPLESNSPAKRSSGGVQEFVEGKRVDGDELLWSGGGGKSNEVAKTIKVGVSFPYFGMRNEAEITQIVATTTVDSGSSKFAIKRGGVGQKSVKFEIVSTDAHNVNYKYQIYGK